MASHVGPRTSAGDARGGQPASAAGGRNLFDDNLALVEALEREGAGWAQRARARGRRGVGRRAARAGAARPTRTRRSCSTHDRYGNRIDEVEFHRAWHDLDGARRLARAARACRGLEPRRARTWRAPRCTSPPRRSRPATRCPITMTFAAVPALRAQPELAAEWEPLLTADDLRPASCGRAARRRSALCGMAMTEKQGGSDVRANTTAPSRSTAAGRRRVRAHRPQVVLLARRCATCSSCWRRPTRALSCFALPRILPDGTRNAFHLQRLKDKLGNRSNASSEVEFARRLGAAGRRARPRRADDHRDGRPHAAGLRASAPRPGCAAGVANATWHAAHRSRVRQAARRPAADAQRARRPVRSSPRPRPRWRCGWRAPTTSGDGDEARAASSAWRPRSASTGSASAAPGHAFEALECLGGNGYVEESGMPRLYREMPLNVDLGGLGQRHGARRAARAGPRAGGARAPSSTSSTRRPAPTRASTRSCARLRAELADLEAIETRARRIVERMALALQGSLLVRHAPPAVADAFCASRLAGDGGLQYGTLPAPRRCGDHRAPHAAARLSRGRRWPATAARPTHAVDAARLRPNGRTVQRRR